MHKGDTIPGLLFTVVGVFFLIPALKLGFTSSTSDGVPGAGFFPAICSVIVIILGLAVSIDGIRKKGAFVYFEMDEEQRKNKIPFFVTIAAIIFFFFIWKFTSFFIAVPIFAFGMNVFLKRSILFNILFTVILTVCIYLAFTKLLMINFII